MLHCSGDLGQRLEHEGPVVHGRVRQDEVGVVEDERVAVIVLVEQQVEVDDAGAFGREVGGADAAHAGFDGEQGAHELERAEAGVEQRGGVGEAGLIAVADGFCGMEAGDSCEFAEVGEAVDGLVQVGFGVAEVRGEIGAQGYGGEHEFKTSEFLSLCAEGIERRDCEC